MPLCSQILEWPVNRVPDAPGYGVDLNRDLPCTRPHSH